MTGQPHITDTHTWDGTRHLPDWLHHDGRRLTLPGRDDDTQPRPGWMLVRWSDGLITVASPQVADRAFGPDGMHGRLQRAEAELADRDAAESADAAAGSYAGRAEAAEARLERAHAECDRLDAAVRASPTNPDFDGAYLAAVRHVRDVLDSEEPAATWPTATRWLHIAFTSPDETTANTSALALRDHLRAEFPGVRMRITSNAVEAEPQPDFTGPLSGIEIRDPCPWCESSPVRIPRTLMDEHVATVHPEVQTLDTATTTPAATEATGIETTARVLAALHRSAEETVTRVIDLHERWVTAGPPPLGVPTARWWDARLVELHDAINPADDTPTGDQP